jgi:hypothetical protein
MRIEISKKTRDIMAYGRWVWEEIFVCVSGSVVIPVSAFIGLSNESSKIMYI